MRPRNYLVYLLSLIAFISGCKEETPIPQFEGNTFTTLITDYPDPFIVYDNKHDQYYLTGTGGPGLTMKSSPTLEGLRTAKKTQFYIPGQEGGPDRDLWAPEIHLLDGIWYAYFTGHSAEDEEQPGLESPQRMHIMECLSDDPAAGPWRYIGKMGRLETIHGIDGTVFDLDEVRYYIWSGPPQGSPIGQATWIAPLINPWTIAEEKAQIAQVDQLWEGTVPINIFGIMEGQSIIQMNGKIFLTYSTFGYLDDRYRIGMLYMDENNNPMDPRSWKKLNGPVFQQYPAKEVYSTGHHCFFTSPDGNEHWFMYHARATSIGLQISDGPHVPPRYCRAQKLSFNESGMPVFGVPIRPGTTQIAPSGETPQPTHAIIANGTYEIIHLSTGLSLHLDYCNPERGANVELSPGTGNYCQLWRVQAVEQENKYTISSERSGMMLEVENAGIENGDNVRLWYPNGSDSHQWELKAVEQEGFIIKNKLSGMVLGVADSDEEGNVIQLENNINMNQFWELKPISE